MAKKLTQEQYIKKAETKWGHVYDLSKIIYVSSAEKICVVCKTHGDFFVGAAAFLAGRGCKLCGYINISRALKKSTTQVIGDFAKVHGGQYVYSEVEYAGAFVPVKIICKTHGAFFQSPTNHLSGAGCPKCAGLKISAHQSQGVDLFIKRALEIHGDLYTYDNAVYKSVATKIQITCRVHGDFWMLPSNHLRGAGCRRCGDKKRGASRTQKCAASILDTFAKKHNGVYSYESFVYAGCETRSTITCRIHGDFTQTPRNHAAGRGCPACRLISIGATKQKTQQETLSQFMDVHGTRYDYSNFVYKKTTQPVIINCVKHGAFKITPNKHIQGQGCPKCAHHISNAETDLSEFVKSLGFSPELNSRKIVPPKELDIYIPEKNVAIEFNGVYWHGDDIKPKSYHKEKTVACAAKGIRLIHVLESEWDTRRPQIEKMLRHALGVSTDEKVNARACMVVEVSPSESRQFVHQNHIQGCSKAGAYNIGLRHGDELVAVMMFAKGATLRGAARLKTTDAPWELSRYATSKNVRGGASKLLAAARKVLAGPIISFSQNDWYGASGMYNKLGFTATGEVPPDYRVWHPKTGVLPKSHWQRRNIPKILELIGHKGTPFDPATDPRTEHAVQDEVGALRIWDSGKTKWVMP